MAKYVFNEAYERPFIHPIIGPNGLCVTREVLTLGDHPHHKGHTIGLGEVGRPHQPGVDFWSLGNLGDPRYGRILQKGFSRIEEGPVFVRIVEENIWRQNDVLEGYEFQTKATPRESWRVRVQGEGLLYERRILTFWNLPASSGRVIDVRTILAPAVEEVALNEDVLGRETRKENGPILVRIAEKHEWP
ncbi:PmoA family protein [Candidatus Bathyarchaeota archaeon]|nr:PmoA family protein [Candidatus Bathyarchaeota archaeon]